MIESDGVVTTQKLKKGKKVGKPVFGGFRFQFNMPVKIIRRNDQGLLDDNETREEEDGHDGEGSELHAFV